MARKGAPRLRQTALNLLMSGLAPPIRAMSRLIVKSAKRAALVLNLRVLRGLAKMVVRRSGCCLANGKRRLSKGKLRVNLAAPSACPYMLQLFEIELRPYRSNGSIRSGRALGAGPPAFGKRRERSNLRGATLIGIWLRAYLSQR